MTADDTHTPQRQQFYRILRSSLLLLTIFLFSLGLLVALDSEIDLHEIRSALSGLDAGFILILLSLSLINYSTRALRWYWFSSGLGLGVPLRKAVSNYVAGFSMGVTPGRVGELVRLWLLSHDLGISYHRAMPMLIADRMNDLIVIIAITLLALSSSGTTTPVAVTVATSIVILVNILLRYPAPMIKGIDAVYGLVRRGHRLFAAARRMLRSGRVMYTFRNSSIASLFGLVAWSAECLAFYLLLDELGTGISLEAASFIYAFSTLVGAISFLPGGLGGFELTAILLLQTRGIDFGAAALSVSVIRLTTLWFSVVLGGVFLGHAVMGRSHRDA